MTKPSPKNAMRKKNKNEQWALNVCGATQRRPGAEFPGTAVPHKPQLNISGATVFFLEKLNLG